MERRLAAILAADVVGYTRLMGKDETGTLAALKAHREELIEPKIAEHRGRLVKLMGDGLLAEFPSVVDAVSCAVAIQEGVAERNVGVPDNRCLDFRIGINIGDVIVENDDIYGDGVNIAARLESMAEPGGVCVSEDVFRHVDGKVDIAFEDSGAHWLKNVSKPVHVYRCLLTIGRDGVVTSRTTGPSFDLPDKPSLAVLPFTNMSNDPDQEYFADGIAEDIITALSRISWFFVTARNSSFSYKGKAVNVTQIGRELGVRYVLEGSVRKSGQRLRITAQLIDALNGNHVWGERFDRDLSDIFDVQDEITRNVVASTQTQVQLREGSFFEHIERPSLPVWALINRAWSLWYELTPEALDNGMRLAEEAVALDPKSGRAYQTLATMHWNTYWMGFSEDLPQTLRGAKDAATKALRCNGHDEYAHWVLGLISMAEGAFDKAVAELERAIEINQNCSLAYGSLGTVLNFAGDPKRSIVNNEIAIRSNPRDPSLFFRYSGLALSPLPIG